MGSLTEAAELLILDALPGVGPKRVQALVRRFGSPDAALCARGEDFAAVAGWPAARARRDRALREGVEEALRRARETSIRVVTWSDPSYPDSLLHLADPPPVLFLRGRAELLARASVTVVGARRATEAGRDVARRLGARLGRHGVVVVSGMALGVDGAAHGGALESGGDTVAVLGTGPDVVYPRTHRRLFAAIRERGLLVSEFLPGVTASPHHFPRRNRILAALSSTTVVVEAGARSGSLITVDHALDLGKDVWAVPGPIDRSHCAGSNRLLSEGARPLVSVEAFVLGMSGGATDRASASVPATVPSDLPEPEGLEARLLGVLDVEPLHADDVALRTGVPVETVLAALTTLELFGEVERMPGMRFRRAA